MNDVERRLVTALLDAINEFTRSQAMVLEGYRTRLSNLLAGERPEAEDLRREQLVVNDHQRMLDREREAFAGLRSKLRV